MRLSSGMGIQKRLHKRLFCLILCIGMILSGLSFASPETGAAADGHEPAVRRFNAAIPKEGPGGPDSREKLAKGKFLVASRRLSDPNFSQTVVLLIEYGPDGAMGLVINRPSNVKLSAVFPDVKELKQNKDTIYVGGPVAVNQMMMLIRSPRAPAASTPVIENVYLSSSWKVLEDLIKKTDAGQRLRLFAGYAGWAPNQLDYERSRGDWHILDADADSVFARDPGALWQDLIRRATVKWVRLEEIFPETN